MEDTRYRGPAYETARLKLARIRVEGRKSRDQASRYLVEVGCEVLTSVSAGLWFLGDEGRTIACDALLEPPRNWGEGKSFATRDCGELLALLGERRLFVIETEGGFPRLGAFGAYLSKATRTAIVCAPILREGRVTGMIAFEQGPLFHREERHLTFAATVADCAALVIEQAERIELEAAVQAASESRAEVQKMQALLRLARSVAHDLNGLLTIVSAASEEVAAPNADLEELARDLGHVADLGKNLAERLLQFGGEPTRGEPVDLGKLVRELTPVVRPLFVGERTVSVLIETDKPTLIVAEPLAVKRCLLNLVTNAADALRDRGAVTIIVREPTPEDPLRIDAVVLEVHDNGIGMDESTQARAIEPYFTTKKHGHGLGLSEVFGIAHRFGGGVRVQSTKGEGTRISVAFPRA